MLIFCFFYRYRYLCRTTSAYTTTGIYMIPGAGVGRARGVPHRDEPITAVILQLYNNAKFRQCIYIYVLSINRGTYNCASRYNQYYTLVQHIYTTYTHRKHVRRM